MTVRLALLAFSIVPALVAAEGFARAPTQEGPRFGVGRPASVAEIAAWDTDVNAAGEGLPPGAGSAATGATLYASTCAACHGLRGEGGAGSQLVKPPSPGGRPRRNIASHWPYAPPLFDYIRRTMPPDKPGSLTDDKVYALVAYLLAENGIVPPDTTVDAKRLREVQMPARHRFIRDDRVGGRDIK